MSNPAYLWLTDENGSPMIGPSLVMGREGATLAQNQCSAKSEIFVFPETSDKFSRSHVI